jgi:nucleoside-diphosphate-sugar epimerase
VPESWPTPRPAEWGRLLVPAIERLERYVISGLPVVTAFAGWVYGTGSWFHQWVMDPILADRHVVQIGTGGPWVSPMHAHDCARALVHLAEHAEPGGRYFLVDTDPIRLHEFARAFARHAARRLRVRRLPKAAAQMIFGPALADHIQTDAVFSNARLRGTGFVFRFPTLDQGMPQLLGALHE